MVRFREGSKIGQEKSGQTGLARIFSDKMQKVLSEEKVAVPI